LLSGLFADAGGGGGEVDAGDELVAARAGERRDEVIEAQKLGCNRRKCTKNMQSVICTVSTQAAILQAS
jgi:hypothetical protein